MEARIGSPRYLRQRVGRRSAADGFIDAIRSQGRGGRHNAHRIHDFYDGRKLLLRVAQIEQLEHAWSGGDETLAYNTKAGPDASKMMMEFFNRHQRA